MDCINIYQAPTELLVLPNAWQCLTLLVNWWLLFQKLDVLVYHWCFIIVIS